MNDRELAKAMRLIAECERRSGSAQPKTIEMLEQGAARLEELDAELLERQESEVRAAACLRGNWFAIDDDWPHARVTARRLVDMGRWEENPTPTNADTIEVRPLKGKR